MFRRCQYLRRPDLCTAGCLNRAGRGSIHVVQFHPFGISRHLVSVGSNVWRKQLIWCSFFTHAMCCEQMALSHTASFDPARDAKDICTQSEQTERKKCTVHNTASTGIWILNRVGSVALVLCHWQVSVLFFSIMVSMLDFSEDMVRLNSVQN